MYIVKDFAKLAANKVVTSAHLYIGEEQSKKVM